MIDPATKTTWTSKSNGKGPYTVLFITNIEHEHKDHPPQVVFIGTNGNLWSRPLSTWHEKMEPYVCV